MIRSSNSVAARDFPVLYIVQTSSGAHLVSYSMVSVVLSRGRSVRGLMLTIHLHLAPKFGMSRAVPPIPLDAFMARTENTYLTTNYVCLEFRRLYLNSASKKYYVLGLLCACHISHSGL
jgi:hypothetical protein